VRHPRYSCPPLISLQLLDTGTTLVGIPLATAQQLYGSIPGAHFDAALGAFSVPCATEMNISITLSQQSCVLGLHL
jgi:phosphate/sulfate permease